MTGLDDELENKLTNIIQFMNPYEDWAPCVEYPKETEGTDNQ